MDILSTIALVVIAVVLVVLILVIMTLGAILRGYDKWYKSYGGVRKGKR